MDTSTYIKLKNRKDIPLKLIVSCILFCKIIQEIGTQGNTMQRQEYTTYNYMQLFGWISQTWGWGNETRYWEYILYDLLKINKQMKKQSQCILVGIRIIDFLRWEVGAAGDCKGVRSRSSWVLECVLSWSGFWLYRCFLFTKSHWTVHFLNVYISDVCYTAVKWVKMLFDEEENLRMIWQINIYLLWVDGFPGVFMILPVSCRLLGLFHYEIRKHRSQLSEELQIGDGTSW